jgi:hypothetical protein
LRKSTRAARSLISDGSKKNRQTKQLPRPGSLIRKRFADLGLEASEFSQSQKPQRSGYDRAPAGPEKAN